MCDEDAGTRVGAFARRLPAEHPPGRLRTSVCSGAVRFGKVRRAGGEGGGSGAKLSGIVSTVQMPLNNLGFFACVVWEFACLGFW